MSKKRAIIIGAGYGGMSLANLLGKSGYKVDVFEKNDAVGGRIAEIQSNGFTFDLGPSWYLMPEVFEHYYSLFGYSAKKRLKLIKLSPGYRVFPESTKPFDIIGDYKVDQNTFEAIEPGSATKFLRYVKDSKLIYELSIKHFLYNNFSRLSDIIKPTVIIKSPRLILLLSKSLHRHVKLRFKSQILQQLLEYQTVFLGGSPFKIPAIYSLMSHLDYESGVFYPKRGMSSLAADMLKIGKEFDITYHLNSPVSSIDTASKVATGVTLQDGSTHTADIVVSNADLKFTETKLLNESHQTYHEGYWQKRQAGPSALIISLGLKGEVPQLLHHNLYFVKDWQKNFEDIYDTKEIPSHASMYICNPTKTDPSLAPKGYENIFVLVPLPSAIKLSKAQESKLLNRVLSILENELKIKDLKNRIVEKNIFSPQDFGLRYNAWENNAFGGESHLLSQSAIFRTKNKSKKVKNLFYVGAGTLPGIGLPMCLISAQLAFKAIEGLTTSGPLEKEDLS